MIGLPALAARKLGKILETRQLLIQALETVVELEALSAASWSLPSVALFLASQGFRERAIEVQALANWRPLVAISRWIMENIWRALDNEVAALPADRAAARARAGGKQHCSP